MTDTTRATADARCHACSRVHVVAGDPPDLERGATLRVPHTSGHKRCGEPAEHTVVAPHDGVNDTPAEEPDATDGDGDDADPDDTDHPPERPYVCPECGYGAVYELPDGITPSCPECMKPMEVDDAGK